MLTKDQKQKIEKIAEKYDLRLLMLFGSQVNGKNKEDSDFDVAYLSQKSLELKQKFELKDDLASVFGSDRIDQVNIRNAGTLLLHEISSNSKLLFGDEIDYIKFKTRAYRIFTDSTSLFKLQDALIRKRHQFLAERIYA
ncbi:MAG: nucleotidyltransferase domain-containing protein [Parcubacteria group bacterium]|nr:nucleotidyltransferase domain-containing protein [Parcubacteria group bacterium]